ncbi:MAG: hypothetical protein D6692_08525 [Planctomycetota bacterium]|nr:MAG: hypothetical protein D6692_08525 [Planctomycetota bacterium]
MPIDVQRARTAIQELETLLAEATSAAQTCDDEQERTLRQREAALTQHTHRLVLALLQDDPVPISLLRPFASYEQFRVWERQGRIRLTRANRKVCVKPGEFFDLWRSLQR